MAAGTAASAGVATGGTSGVDAGVTDLAALAEIPAAPITPRSGLTTPFGEDGQVVPHTIPTAPGWDVLETPDFVGPDVDEVIDEIIGDGSTTTSTTTTTTVMVPALGGSATVGRPNHSEPRPSETSSSGPSGASPLVGRDEMLAQRIAYLLLRDLLAILDAMDAALATAAHGGHDHEQGPMADAPAAAVVGGTVLDESGDTPMPMNEGTATLSTASMEPATTLMTASMAPVPPEMTATGLNVEGEDMVLDDDMWGVDYASSSPEGGAVGDGVDGSTT